MTNLIDITDLSDSALDALLNGELTVDTVDADVVSTGDAAIGTCIVEAVRAYGFTKAKVSGRAVELTHYDCEYIVEQIAAAHGRKPTPAECAALGISTRYALTAFDLEA